MIGVFHSATPLRHLLLQTKNSRKKSRKRHRFQQLKDEGFTPEAVGEMEDDQDSMEVELQYLQSSQDHGVIVRTAQNAPFFR